MSDAIEVPKHIANTFKTNVYHQAQQVGDIIAGDVRRESHDRGAETVFYDSYKERNGIKKRTERAQKTNIATTGRERRAVRADFFDTGEFIDKIDKVKQMHDPLSPLTKAFALDFKRFKDQVVYDAALGTAYTGQKGLDAVVLPDTQKVVAFDGTTTGGIANLNIATLAKLKRKFWDNNIGTGNDLLGAGMPQFCIALRGSQVEQMLNDPTITSADYNSVMALMKGDIDSFMGFKFKIFNGADQNDEQIAYNNATGAVEAGGTNTGSTRYDRCLVWYRDGILLSEGQGMMMDVGPRRDLSNVTQIYADMHLGAVRMEEEKVIELICKA